MAKKTDGARPPRSGTKLGVTLATVAGAKRSTLVRIDDVVAQGAVFRQDDVRLVVGRSYPMDGRDVVVLTEFETRARMPMGMVVWSRAFPDTRVRDDFFAWLAVRVGRWEDWGRLAYSKGADALTSHLLGLFAAGLSPLPGGLS